MHKLFNKTITEAVEKEQIVAIPNFPGNDNKISGPKICFVTPEMERIYKERSGNDLPSTYNDKPCRCVVDMRIPAIMILAADGLHSIPNMDGIFVMTTWKRTHSDSMVKVI